MEEEEPLPVYELLSKNPNQSPARFFLCFVRRPLVCRTVCGGGVLCRLVNNHKGSRKKERGKGQDIRSNLRIFYFCVILSGAEPKRTVRIKVSSEEINVASFSYICSKIHIWDIVSPTVEPILPPLFVIRCLNTVWIHWTNREGVFTPSSAFHHSIVTVSTTAELRITQLTLRACGGHSTKRQKSRTQLGNGEA